VLPSSDKDYAICTVGIRFYRRTHYIDAQEVYPDVTTHLTSVIGNNQASVIGLLDVL